MNISIIIIHWNTPELLRKQLRLLGNDPTMEIIVIDNNSSQKINWIEQEFLHVSFKENKINHGYAMACNQGTVHAKGEWLLFLNPDVEIQISQIRQMLNQCQQTSLDACSPEPESDNYKKPIPTAWTLLEEFTPLKRFRRDGACPVSTLTGGCLLIKSNVLRKLGGFDERFFLWFEDSDLTKRLVDNNYKTEWIDVPIKHIGGSSFKGLNEQLKRDIFFHSMEIYARKHFSPFGQNLIKLIKQKYSKRKVLPPLHDSVSLTVPNLKVSILEDFFKNNAHVLQKLDELIIVTSALNDETVWEWRKKYPQIRFIPIKKNSGFASTVNIGFRASTGKWIGTINDDTMFTEEWIQKSLIVADNKTGSINPIIYATDNTIESAGIKILMKGKAIPINDIEIRRDAPPDFVKTTSGKPGRLYSILSDATNGAAVLYRNDALNEAGIFDERFGSYLEDIDLSLRLKRNGWNNIVCTEAKVTHSGHATSSQTIWKKKPRLDFRNWIYVILKNWSISELILHSPEIILERLRNISGIIKS